MDKQLVIDCLELVGTMERSHSLFKPLADNLRPRLKEELEACELQEQLLRAEPFGPLVAMPKPQVTLEPRAELAARAMQGLLACGISGRHKLPTQLAREAVEHADALIAELQRKEFKP